MATVAPSAVQSTAAPATNPAIQKAQATQGAGGAPAKKGKDKKTQNASGAALEVDIARVIR